MNVLSKVLQQTRATHEFVGFKGALSRNIELVSGSGRQQQSFGLASQKKGLGCRTVDLEQIRQLWA